MPSSASCQPTATYHHQDRVPSSVSAGHGAAEKPAEGWEMPWPPMHSNDKLS